MVATCSPRNRWLKRASWSGVAALLWGAGPVAFAQTGTVAGTVTDRATGQPIRTARVQVVGSQTLSASTDDRGRFSLRNVPSGPQSLRASRIGFRQEVHSFAVQANDTTRADFTSEDGTPTVAGRSHGHRRCS